MRDLLNGFFLVKSVLQKDRIIILLALVPIVMGVLIYFLLGSWIYGDILGTGLEWIKSYLDGDFGETIRYALVSLFTVIMFFLVNWTFVLIVSLLAAPFNDMISTRVEKVLVGLEMNTLDESLKKVTSRIFEIILNEIKKIIFIIILGFLAFGMGLFPILSPISLIISALLMAINFIDYSWSRHKMSFKECLFHLKSSLFVYGLSGGLFMVLLSIPVINLFVLPLAVIYFTILFVKRSET